MTLRWGRIVARAAALAPAAPGCSRINLALGAAGGGGEGGHEAVPLSAAQYRRRAFGGTLSTAAPLMPRRLCAASAAAWSRPGTAVGLGASSEPQANIAFWERSSKPPRSDVLPKLARVLAVRVEDLLDVEAPLQRRSGPVGRVAQVFDEVRKLPRRQQEKVADVVAALVEQYRRKAS